MKTRKEAEARAMELFPDNSIPNSTTVYQSDIENEQKREAYLQCWDEMQVANDARQAADEVDNDKLREAAEKVVLVERVSELKTPHRLKLEIKKLEKALK